MYICVYMCVFVYVWYCTDVNVIPWNEYGSDMIWYDMMCCDVSTNDCSYNIMVYTYRLAMHMDMYVYVGCLQGEIRQRDKAIVCVCVWVSKCVYVIRLYMKEFPHLIATWWLILSFVYICMYVYGLLLVVGMECVAAWYDMIWYDGYYARTFNSR